MKTYKIYFTDGTTVIINAKQYFYNDKEKSYIFGDGIAVIPRCNIKMIERIKKVC